MNQHMSRNPPRLYQRRMPRSHFHLIQKLEVPSQPFQPDEQPVVASGSSSGSKDGVRQRRDPQPEDETEVKLEPNKVEEEQEPPPKGTLSLAIQRIHDKL